jgi:hypothetical protein
MYGKIIEEVCREPLGEIQYSLKKMVPKQNRRGARSL